MKAGKVKLISFVSVLSIFLVFIGIFIISQYISGSNKKNEEENSKYVLDEAYSYPVLPGTEQWNSFPSVLEKREACYVSEETLSKMTTSALVETVVTYPLFTDVNCFDTLEMGVEWVSQYFGGFEELKERTDAKESVIKFINSLYPGYLELKNDEEFEKCFRDFEKKDSRFEIIHLINAKTLLTYLDSLDSSNSKENRAFSYGNTYFDIITPNGTYVTAFQGHIWSDHGKQPAVVQIENNNLEANYSSANVLYPINPSYN